MTSQSPAFRRTVALLMAEHNRRMAERIRYYRKRAGLTETELAAKVGVRERTVRRWESGETEPQPPNLRGLAEELQVKLDDIRPDLEAEERGLQNQLNRIETKLNRLLARLGVNPNDNGSKP